MALIFGAVNRAELAKLREHGFRVLILRDGSMAQQLKRSVHGMRKRGERFVMVKTPERPFQTLSLTGDCVLDRGREAFPGGPYHLQAPVQRCARVTLETLGEIRRKGTCL